MRTAMGTASNPSFLRAMLAERLAVVLDDIEQAAGEVSAHARHDCANQLNQAVRRLWQAPNVAALADTLADAAAQFASGAAVLSVEDNVSRTESVRPLSEAWRAAGTRTALRAAPALAAAIQSREPVIAAATESELGGTLAALALYAGHDRVAVFPVLSHEGVPALICAWGAVEASAQELLAKMAGEEWGRFQRAAAEAEQAEAAAIAEAQAAARAEAEAEAQAAAEAAEQAQAQATAEEEQEAVGVAGNGAPPQFVAPLMPAETAEESNWENLPAVEQRLHLRAQRVARVRVAEWRLREGARVRSGRARGDLYAELAPKIEEARKSFHSQFFGACPSMVDYLHLEMVHTLANDDAELLGKDYPGPML